MEKGGLLSGDKYPIEIDNVPPSVTAGPAVKRASSDSWTDASAGRTCAGLELRRSVEADAVSRAGPLPFSTLPPPELLPTWLSTARFRPIGVERGAAAVDSAHELLNPCIVYIGGGGCLLSGISFRSDGGVTAVHFTLVSFPLPTVANHRLNPTSCPPQGIENYPPYCRSRLDSGRLILCAPLCQLLLG